MNIHDLTVNQLKRAAAIKEQLASLNLELRNILGAPSRSWPSTKKMRTMSVSARRKIAAAQRRRWANLRQSKSARRSSETAAGKTMSAAAKAKLSAKMKRHWAAKKAGKT
jgi:hypothetical protein